jgi:LacI family transcriptional regulator
MAGTAADGLKRLAELTGVSISTVSRVLSGKAEKVRISAKTRERVLLEAGRHGVVINEVARGLRLRTTQTLGLIIPDISNPFFAALARQAERASRAKGFSVLLCDSGEDSDLEARNVILMKSRRVDGLLVAPVGGRYDHLAAVQKSGTPLVLLDRLLPELEVPGVAADNAAGAALAVEHLLARGHREIGCLQGLPASSTNAARVGGIQRALKRHQLSLSASRLAGRDYTLPSARAEALRLLSTPHRPTAIIALGNVMALGVLHAARELGIHVPEQLSLISFDDQPWAEWISPPLTTVAQPVEELGARAMELFFETLSASRSGGEACTTQVILPMTLIPRGSVLPPP